MQWSRWQTYWHRCFPGYKGIMYEKEKNNSKRGSLDIMSYKAKENRVEDLGHFCYTIVQNKFGWEIVQPGVYAVI